MKNRLIIILFFLPCLINGGIEFSKKSKKDKSLFDFYDLDYKTSFDELNPEIKEFINDYKNWPKKEQQKIILRHFGYMIPNKPNYDEQKYGNSLDFWLDCRLLNQEKIGHFINILYKIQKD
ncbi:MAG: hypothetical protein WDZ41_00045 [Candidatus Babeliales bacterium]